MERDLKDILTEVLVFPYEQDIVDSLTTASKNYAEEITLSQFEDCVLHLCLDITAHELVQSVNTQTGRKFPGRVYRALSGYVIGETISNVEDEDEKLLYVLALRNVLKVKNDEVDGIISKCINPTYFSVVEDYWTDNTDIPSLEGDNLITDIYDKDTWAETGWDIEDSFETLKALAKFYSREQFEKEYSQIVLQDNQDAYKFAYDVAKDVASQYWLFAAENPIRTFKNIGLKGSAIALNTIKSRMRGEDFSAQDGIEATSVYRRYLYANDYTEISTKRISPQSFVVAIFYEFLYERLKSQRDE